MRWLFVVLVACGSPHTRTTDGSVGDGAPGDDAAIDASVSPSGLSPLEFSINWPARDVLVPAPNNPWPTLAGDAYGGARTWGSVVDWFGIEPDKECDPKDDGTCWVWASLDSFLSRAHEVHFVPGDYPLWANGSSAAAMYPHAPLPTDVMGSGACSTLPPEFVAAAQLRAGDCLFQELMFAIAMHTCTGCGPSATGPWKGTLKIRSFSTGNEINGAEYVGPPCKKTATASCAALARMSEDLYKIVKYVDSTVTVGTPSFTQVNGDVDMAAYLELPSHPGDFADVMIFHIYGQGLADGSGYWKNAGMPEVNWPARIGRYAHLLDDAHHMPHKPMWVDEGGWGENFQTNFGPTAQACGASECGCANAPTASCMTADGLANTTVLGILDAPAPGYLVRGYLEMIANGVERFYWYGPAAGEWGSWATYDNNAFTATATVAAWQSMHSWLVGAQMGALSSSGTTWSYTITGKTGTHGCSTQPADAAYAAVIAWKTDDGAATTACGAFTHYCTLFDATEHACSGSAPIGPNPILLEP